MGAKRYYHSLRSKITLILLLSVTVELAIMSWFRYISFRHLLLDSLESPVPDVAAVIETQLAAYVRSRVILSVGSIAVVLLISELLMSKMVISKLRHFLDVVRRIGAGERDARVEIGGHDEIAVLATAFNQMTEQLDRQAERLSVLNALAATVSQSLNLEEVLRTALNDALELMHLRAGWIMLRDGDRGEFSLAATRDLPPDVARVHAQCDWKRCVCADVFQSGQAQVFDIQPGHPCPAAEHLQAEGFVFRACVPLRSKDRVWGVMSLAGGMSNGVWTVSRDSLGVLTAIGRQVGTAIENASLYEELRHTEALRRQLLERGIDLQEEERRRIARGLHDQTSQQLTSILMTLGALGKAQSIEEVRARVGELRELAAQTLEEVHELALERFDHGSWMTLGSWRPCNTRSESFAIGSTYLWIFRSWGWTTCGCRCASKRRCIASHRRR